MNDIAELQKIWMTNGNEVANGAKGLVPDSLMKNLKSLETFQNKINRIKIVLLTVTILLMFFMLTTLKVFSIFTYLGFGVILASIVIFMIYYLRNQFKTSKLDFTSGSIDFTESTLKALQKQNAIFKAPALILILSITLGLNLLLYGLSTDLTSDEIVEMYIFDNTIVIISSIVGYKLRMWRIKKEVTPLIDELTKAKKSLSSES